jgi:hypothetical protein
MPSPKDENKNEFATCDDCGWVGAVKELKPNPRSPIPDCCPECGSPETWWPSQWGDNG